MKTAWISCLLALLLTLPLRAEQMKELGPWQVHYSAFNSSFLTPEVAKAYGLGAAATTASSTSRCRTSRGSPRRWGSAARPRTSPAPSAT